MPSQYRKPTVTRTQSSFSDDQAVNRATHTKRDADDVSVSSIGIYDIDKAVRHFLRDGVKPVVVQDGEVHQVPVMYANPEKWSSAQKHGYLRDEKNHLMYPLIMFRRTAIEQREELRQLKVSRPIEENRYHFANTYSKRNRYDKFSKLLNRTPIKEYYTVDMPEHIRISYQVLIWTHYTEQMNNIIAKVIFEDKKAYGETNKFSMSVDDYSIEYVNEHSSDRISKCTLNMHCNAYLLPKDIGDRVNAQKLFTRGVLRFNFETVEDEVGLKLKGRPVTEEAVAGYNLITEDSLYYIITEDNFYIGYDI